MTRAGLAFPALLVATSLLLSACAREVKRYVANAGPQTPTMSTADVNTFISDSGYTRYHLQTPLWLIYDDSEEPFWRFPDGLDLEQFDKEHRLESTVVCDSAIYWSRKRLWRLDGNVVMVSTAGDSFLTQQLFWDQNTRRINSDSFIHIVRSDRILEGYGFESDQGMNDYIIHRPTAILPSSTFHPGAQNVDADSTAASADSMDAASDSLARSRRVRAMNTRPSERKTESNRLAPGQTVSSGASAHPPQQQKPGDLKPKPGNRQRIKPAN